MAPETELAGIVKLRKLLAPWLFWVPPPRETFPTWPPDPAVIRTPITFVWKSFPSILNSSELQSIPGTIMIPVPFPFVLISLQEIVALVKAADDVELPYTTMPVVPVGPVRLIWLSVTMVFLPWRSIAVVAAWEL